jgi:predicted nucleotide-binding protein (sugar kinase/HSP70/actin superfamily)
MTDRKSAVHGPFTQEAKRLRMLLAQRSVEELVEEERQRLRGEAGLEERRANSSLLPPEPPFTREERGKATIVVGGLTKRHDQFLKAILESHGHRVELVPIPSKEDFQVGREFGSNGMCNPTYFTVGSCINHLRRAMREHGLSRDEAARQYVFITPGSCGPCRFGMYESEYRNALHNAGFKEARVLVVDQYTYQESDEDAGLELGANLFMPAFEACFVGDLLNAAANQIRPYEIEAGSTDRAMEKVTQRVCTFLRKRDPRGAPPRTLARSIAWLMHGKPRQAQIVLDHLLQDDYVQLMRECAETINSEVQVDYTRIRPVCKIMGEFWAQTTEGDGNFHMFAFLEEHGGQVLIEPVATWFQYLLANGYRRIHDKRRLTTDGYRLKDWDLFGRAGEWFTRQRNRALVYGMYHLVRREYHRLRDGLSPALPGQADQFLYQKLAQPYYDRRCTGGEGHLEVAKSLYYGKERKAHLILSLKPFGCLPSTQSDGAQAAVVGHNPDINFISIETSGEGDVNAHSRVLMMLSEAKRRCREEVEQAIADSGYTLEDIRAYAAEHPELQKPLQPLPEIKGAASAAARFAARACKLMKDEGVPAST